MAKQETIEAGDNEFGFSPDKFEGYLTKQGKFMWISFIMSKQPKKGNLKVLFDKIESLGYTIIVPTPSNRMMEICKKRGMELCEMRSDGEWLQAMVKVQADISVEAGKVVVTERKD